MGAPAVPPVIPQPWATGNPSLTNDIPNTTTTAGLASWAQGFPADTMQPVVAGGVPPFGQDMNGLGFAISSHDYYVQAGETYPYQAAVSTALGGYGQGCLLGSATDPDVVWFNTVANNTSNPDATDGSAVGWVSLFAYGFATPAAMTGAAPVSLTNLQASRKFIVLTGALGANQTVSLPAGILKDWLIINNTSGSSFTLTLNTTASGSAGVAVPQGGWSNPLGVYSDGTNVYPTVAPLGIPISQAPTPLTLAERDNTGQLTANYFVGASSFETPTASGMLMLGPDLSAFRKVTVAYFESVLNLVAIGGQVSAGQVPLAAVIQYVTNILSSAALTGTPTAPTPAPGTTNTQIATAAFANPPITVNGNGVCLPLPNGYKLQMGSANAAGGTVAVIFPVPFTSSVFPVTGSYAGGAVESWIVSGTITLTGMHVANTGGITYYIAIGE